MLVEHLSSPTVYSSTRNKLAGNRDLDRDASASSDERTLHGLRFFQVEDKVSDKGLASVG